MYIYLGVQFWSYERNCSYVNPAHVSKFAPGSGLGANLLLLICCSKFFASVCKCGRMNAQQIYLYMYFTNLTALISILSIFMVGHDFCENIISKAPFIRRKFAYVC